MEQSAAKLGDAIRKLYGLVNLLEEDYARYERHFTIDGHLLGSIGEVYAAERYGIELLKSSSKTHDGVSADGRLVQIKVTQRKSVALSSEPNYLLVLHVDEGGKFDEVYNGPGSSVWDLVRDKRLPKNGQYQISLTKLAGLNASVSEDDRIEVAPWAS